MIERTEYSSVWPERAVWVREVRGSNPLIPTFRCISSCFAFVVELVYAPGSEPGVREGMGVRLSPKALRLEWQQE